MLIAVHLQIVTVAALNSWRRIVIIVCFVVSAVITPTQDFLTMTIVALPLWLLYEGALVVAGAYSDYRDAKAQGRSAKGRIFARLFKTACVLLVVAVAAVAGYLAYVRFMLPDVGPAPDLKVEATPALVARGEYLATHVTACIDCHSTRDWSRFSGPLVAGTRGQGGETFGRAQGFPGVFIARNITPAGIGEWTDGELFRAITTGVARDGSALFSVMPYHNYGRMDPEDIKAIIAYVRSLPAAVNAVAPRQVDFPLNLLLNTLPQAAAPQPRPPVSDAVAYGGYVANAAGCVECHTKQERGKKVGPLFAGGFEFRFPDGGIVRSTNLTPDATGLQGWTREQFIARFKAFLDPAATPQVDTANGGMQTVMPWTMYAGMTNEDLGAIFDYLRQLAPVANQVERWTAPGATSASPAVESPK
jgi:mono/diheme cytochrome c family protein